MQRVQPSPRTGWKHPEGGPERPAHSPEAQPPRWSGVRSQTRLEWAGAELEPRRPRQLRSLPSGPTAHAPP
eukprot:13701300-Alexandrium_andersonii.AAC.1